MSKTISELPSIKGQKLWNKLRDTTQKAENVNYIANRVRSMYNRYQNCFEMKFLCIFSIDKAVD